MKTLEFKVHFNQEQTRLLWGWSYLQAKVWNEGLRLLKDLREFSYWDKDSKTYCPCCPVPWYFHYDKNIKESFPASRIWSKKSESYCCPVPLDYKEPEIVRHLVNPKTGKERTLESAITSYFSQEKNPCFSSEFNITQKIINTLCDTLMTAWKQFLCGKRGEPRFKNTKDAGSKDFFTVSNGQAGMAKITKHDRIYIPNIGVIHVKGLSDRWGEVIVRSYRITKRASGWYLLLVGDVPTVVHPPSDKVVGIDPGITSVITLDSGKSYKPLKESRCHALRYRRLQRKMARQQAQQKRTGIESNGLKKTKQQIALLAERKARRRKAYNHKISSKIVQEYGAIAFEDTKLKNITRKPKAKLKEDGSGFENNGAKAKAGLNKAFANAAIGQLREMVKTKSKTHDREYTAITPVNTSITCNACGTVDKRSRMTQAKFICTACGHADNADSNAAKNILNRGLTDFVRSYRTWVREVKRVERNKVHESEQVCAVKPEGGQSPPSPEYGDQQPLNKIDQFGKPKRGKPKNLEKPLATDRKKRALPKQPIQLLLW